MVTNLTNTTWEIPAGWTATAGYGQFSVNNNASSTYVNPSGTATYSQFNIGYNKTGGNYANTIQVGEGGIGNSYPISVTFTGGTDVTNPQLISWLEANGTLQGGETPTPKLYIGNKAVTSMSIGNKAILKMYVGNSLIYEKASGEESVTSWDLQVKITAFTLTQGQYAFTFTNPSEYIAINNPTDRIKTVDKTITVTQDTTFTYTGELFGAGYFKIYYDDGTVDTSYSAIPSGSVVRNGKRIIKLEVYDD